MEIITLTHVYAFIRIQCYLVYIEDYDYTNLHSKSITYSKYTYSIQFLSQTDTGNKADGAHGPETSMMTVSIVWPYIQGMKTITYITSFTALRQ